MSQVNCNKLKRLFAAMILVGVIFDIGCTTTSATLCSWGRRSSPASPAIDRPQPLAAAVPFEPANTVTVQASYSEIAASDTQANSVAEYETESLVPPIPIAIPTAVPVTNAGVEVASAVAAAPIVFPETKLLQPTTPAANEPIASTSKPTAKLVIVGVRPDRGPVKVAIYTTANAFPNPSSASQTFELAATQTTLETTLSTADRFAVGVYQDINDDGELNRNRFGIPTEPFAFSNNAMGQRGPPSFEQAAVDRIGNSQMPVNINLP